MTAAEVTADLTYDELARIWEENGEPFDSRAQCDLFLRVASILRRRTPQEAEQSGNRIATRDLLDSIHQARKARAVFLIADEKPTVIVPTNTLM